MTAADVRAARQSLGLTQAQLAPLLGYAPGPNPQARVSDLERGVHPVDGAKARLLTAYLDGYRPLDWPA